MEDAMSLKIRLFSIVLISFQFFTFFGFLSCQKTEKQDTQLQAVNLEENQLPVKKAIQVEQVKENELQIPPLLEAVELKPLQVSITGCDSLDGIIVFHFNLPMVSDELLESAPIPDITINPDIKGEYRWTSSTELIFQPVKGATQYGQYINVTMENAVPLAGEKYQLTHSTRRSFRVPYFEIAGKVASWPIIKGQPQFISLLNWNTRKIGTGPLFILYDQAIDAKKVQPYLKVLYKSGIELKAKLYRPKNIDQVFDEKVNTSYILALQIPQLPDNGDTLNLKIPTWVTSDSIELVHRTLIVNKIFKIEDAYVDYRGKKINLVPMSMSWNLLFNRWIEIEQLNDKLKITPQPKSINISSFIDYNWNSGDRNAGARIKLELEPGTNYRLSVDRSFSDVLGNNLEASFDTTFRTQDLIPILEVPKEPLIVERQANKLPLQIRNITGITAYIYNFETAQSYAKALMRGKRKKISDYGLKGFEKEFKITIDDFKPNELTRIDLPLNDNKGMMCVEVTAQSTGSEAKGLLTDAILVQCTDLAITSKIFKDSINSWITNLKDTQPVVNASVKLFDGAKVVSNDTTDAMGICNLEAVNIATQNALTKPISIIAEKNGLAVVSYIENNHLSNAWQFGLKGNVKGYNPLYASIFTERGVYRPGENVHLKIIVGKNNENKTDSVIVNIEDPRGQRVLKKTLKLDQYFTTNLDIKLKEQAAVGEYFVQIANGHNKTSNTFQVEEYRVPTFQVFVFSDQKEWKIGDKISADINASYLHGTVLSGRPIRWDVRRDPVPFEPAAFPKYVFVMNNATDYAGSVTHGEGRLDSYGNITIHFQPDHPSTIGPMNYTVEGTVTDIDRQAYAGRFTKVIHPAQFYIGLKPPSRKILQAESILNVPMVIVNSDYTIRKGVKCTVLLERIDHHTAARMSESGNVQMLNRPEAVQIQYCEVKSKETAINCQFLIPEAGYYRVRAWAKDDDHRMVQSGFEFTASGDNPTAWPRFDQDIISVIADKPEYKIGDVAKLVVQSPYKNAKGLLTIEQGSVISRSVFDINNNTPELEIPIISRYAPNVFVSVIIIRGRIHNEKDASGYETGAPGFKIGYANLKVDPEDRKLSIKAIPSHSIAHPGQKIHVDIQLKDHKKTPVSGQVTLMVVDEAVLGLTDYKTPDPVIGIYAEHPLGVRTGTSIFELPHAKRSRLEKIFPGGGKDKTDLFSRFPETLRKLFMSTAYWNPNIIVGPDGKAMIEFDLPDNLTTYRVMAIVTDKNSRIGSTDDQIVVRKPVMIQPVITRFVYPDDKLEIEAIVFNGTSKSGSVQLISEFSGVELVNNDARRSGTIEAGGEKTFKFAIKVTGRDEATIRFAAQIGSYTDAIEVKIPILEPGTKRTIVETKMVDNSGTIITNIPAERIPNSTHFEVVTSTTALSELKGAVQYLMRYPNGCIEQTTSTAYPLVVLKDLLPEMGVEVNLADLKKFSEAGIKRILSFQTSGGGLAYWPGGTEPHAFATAFGLTALIEAKKKGYDVPDQALAGMADYLESVLRKGDVTESIPHGNMADGDTRALFVMTLGRLGRPQPGYVSMLWNKKEKLTPFGLSFLAIAVKEMPGDKSLLEPILAEIKQIAEENDKEHWYEGKPKGGWSLDSPLRTHASALLAYATSGKTDGTAGKFMNGLLKRRRNGLWGNTQENVFGIMGVYAATSRKLGGDVPKMLLTVNGKEYHEADLEKNSDRVLRLTLTESDLRFDGKTDADQEVTLKNNSATPMYLTVRSQFDVPLTEENCQAQSNGFEISRKYETLDGESLEGETIHLGSLVRVRIMVKTSSNYHYVAIDDKLPAGLEPLNTNLKTTERVSQGEFTSVVQHSLSCLSYSEIRDSRVAFYVDEMLPNQYEYHYVARATTPGIFLRPAGRVEAMYQPEICGMTSIDYIRVEK
jgi:uncharacterized protein YfaS (alpha-2-macroglobulin family)